MRTRQDSEHFESIRAQTVETLREVIGSARDVAVLDAPNQRNVGDSLIWEGELAYLSRLGLRIRYVADLNSYDARDVRRRLPDGGVVLLHGGGNFGDLWPGHQQHRERIVTELPDFKIVQLSQSIYFGDPARAERANQILSAHPDFHVLIRDNLSLTRAADLLPGLNCTFCPDMALGYEPELAPRRAEDPREVLVIARADKESASGLRSVPENWLSPMRVVITDWGLHAKDSMSWRRSRALAKVNHKLVAARRKLPLPIPVLPQRVVEKLIRNINKRNVDSALHLYASARAIVVDRLHAHVLAAILGKDHVMLDNNYRKLGAVFDDYTGRFSTAHYRLDLDDAKRQLQEIVR